MSRSDKVFLWVCYVAMVACVILLAVVLFDRGQNWIPNSITFAASAAAMWFNAATIRVRNR